MVSEKMPWDELIEKRLETIPEPERDVSTMAWVNFSAFQEWLESKDIDISATEAADLFPVVIDAILFGRDQAEKELSDRDTYKKLFEHALKCIDAVFQKDSTKTPPILPDFAYLGEDKFEAVKRLASEYVDYCKHLDLHIEENSRLRSENARLNAPKLFPIQQSNPIPWEEAERAYRTYAKLYGTSQSLDRLAQRGGFGVQELSCFWHGCNYCGKCPYPPISERERQLASKDAEIERLKAERAELEHEASLWKWLTDHRCTVWESANLGETWCVSDVDGVTLGTGPTPLDAISDAKIECEQYSENEPGGPFGP